MKNKAKTFTDQKGDTFLVRIIEKGERYGAGLLVTDKDNNEHWLHDAAATWDSPKPGVIFYDYEYADFKSFGPRGQQVSTYFVETMLEDVQWARGLCLQGGIAKWTIDSQTMYEIRVWLRDQTGIVVKPDAEDVAYATWKEWGPQ